MTKQVYGKRNLDNGCKIAKDVVTIFELQSDAVECLHCPFKKCIEDMTDRGRRELYDITRNNGNGQRKALIPYLTKRILCSIM